MLDIKLDKTTHDLDLSQSDLSLIDEIDYIEQKSKIELLFFFAEWFLDITKGIKYWEVVFVKNPNLSLIDSLFKAAILEIPGVDTLTAYDSTFNSLLKKFTLEYTVSTDLGELRVTQEVP